MRLLLFSMLTSFSMVLLAQSYLLPLSHSYNSIIDEKASIKGSGLHVAFKPIVLSDSLRHLYQFNSKDSVFISKKKYHNIWRKLLNQHLISISKKDFELKISPLFQFDFGKSLGDDNLYFINTRGAMLQGSIGSNLSFYSDIYENQARFLPYVLSYNSMVAPGQGLLKPFKENAYDFLSASGYISYQVKYFSFQFGNGKNFIGEGYRSLLLSDNAFNYPYFRINTNIWKFQYTNLWGWFMDMTEGSYYSPKNGAFHFLNYQVAPWIEIGLFEGIIFQSRDSLNSRNFDVNYLNPIIFYRSVEFNMGSADNAIMGANFKIIPFNKHILYGQVILDDFNFGESKKGSGFFQNKYGIQSGIKIFDLAGIDKLYFQTEFNSVRPYTYAHKTASQNYAHYGQALAHPLGANFNESVTFLNYSYQNFSINLKFLYATYGADTSDSHWGKDIFISDYSSQNGLFSFGNAVGQGVKTILTYKDVTLSYLINPQTNLKLYVGYSGRREVSELEDNLIHYYFFGIKTDLRNIYYDY